MSRHPPRPKGRRPRPPPQEKPGDENDPNVLYSRFGCRVERRPNGLVVKYGLLTVGEEAAQKQARSLLGERVPLVHDEYPNPYDKNYLFIWMDYVDGFSLEEVWPDLNEDQKRNIAKDLGSIIEQMRYHGPPEDWEGVGSRGLVRDLRSLEAYDGDPCEDEASFNDFLLEGISEGTPPEKREELTHLVDEHFSGHRICFTHADLKPRNIIVKDNQIQALIDWEYGGWYPEYWEYVKFLHGSDKHKDWHQYVGFMFPKQYEKELAVYDKLRAYQNM